MSDLKQTELMYAVLDGEAASGEALELERLLAADRAARAQFEQLRRLFDGLASVPKAFPPEGLVASVMAKIPQDSRRPDRFDQLLSASRVFAKASKRARGAGPGASVTVHRVSRPGPFFRGTNMSERQTPSSANARPGSVSASQRPPWSSCCSTRSTSRPAGRTQSARSFRRNGIRLLRIRPTLS